MSDELMHYGVTGMRWGVRRAGPGRYLTKKRQLSGDKRDLENLNKGKHISIGLTKKRQAAFDKRDKAALEKRIAKNAAKTRPSELERAKITTGMRAVKKILSALTTPVTSGPMKNRGPVKY